MTSFEGMTREQQEVAMTDGFMRQIKNYQGLGPDKMHWLIAHFWDEKYDRGLTYPWMTGPIAGNEQ